METQRTIKRGGVQWLAVLAGLVACAVASSAQSLQQTIALAPGWNLISVQVGTNGFPISQIQSNLLNLSGVSTPAALQSIWSYDGSTRTWQQAAFTGVTNYPNTLTTVAPGKGYWIKVSQSVNLTLSGTPWNGAVQLFTGWNLVGFGGLGATTNDALTLSSVFRENLARLPQIWTYDVALGGFFGYDSAALPPISTLTALEPGRGYWVNSLDPLGLMPQPEIILPGDIDIPPLQTVQTNGLRSAGTEDIAAGTDLNGNGLLDDALTQDTLIFKEGINQQLITIANSGAGVIDWSASENVTWLALDGTNAVSGSTATEFDYITVTVNRAGLEPGTHTASFLVVAGAKTRTINVILKVPAVDGDWAGYASTTRVNAKPVSLGKVDLNMTIYSKSTNITEKNFQAVINRELSILFPRDVFMTGTFYQDNDFFLTTNFEVPQGERNAPPFETFSNGNTGSNTNWTGDIDNGDQILDNSNPFPFPLRREITLIGRRVDENHLAGSYYESLQNILPNGQRITVEGEFQLERTSLTPTLTSIYNKTTSTNIIIGASSPSALTNTINVPVSVNVQGVTVSATMDFALGSGVTLTLYSPSNQAYQLDNAAFSGARTYDVSAFNGTDGKGNWKLVVRWTPNGERGFFQGWSLNVKGLAVYSAAGTIVTGATNSPTAISGARVTLTGNNFVDERFTTNNGQFSFSGLTENDFTLTISKVGYQDAVKSFSITSSNASLGNIFLTPVTNTSIEMTTAPWIGGQPLTVNFRTVAPLNLLSNFGTIYSNVWRFGDGALDSFVGQISPEVEHTYSQPGYYYATNQIFGSLSSTTIVSRLITVLPSSAPAGGTNNYYLSSVAFIGSIASPSVVPTSATNGTVYQESKRDVAGFDLDRFPFRSGNNINDALEDTDFFVQPAIANAPVTRDGLFTAFPRLAVVNNSTNRFRMITTMGGAVFGEQPSRVAQYLLQSSRIEP